MANANRWQLTDEQKHKLIMTLTSELKVLRAKVGISQEDLAHMIGVSRQTYRTIEARERTMSWNTYLSLILFYDYMKDTHSMLRTLGIFPEGLVHQINGMEVSRIE